MEIIKILLMIFSIGILFLIFGIYFLVDWIKNRKTLYWEYKEFEGGIPVGYYRHLFVSIFSIIIGTYTVLNYFNIL
jgi:hypothetical protein